MRFNKEHAKWAAMTRRPGKFEGEQAYVPYFWDVYLNGFADDERNDILYFKVRPDDVAIFPELKGRKRVKLYRDNQGFVTEMHRLRG